MKCPNCNVEVAETTRFCPKCGTKLYELSSETTPVLELAEDKQTTIDPVIIPEKKKKKTKKTKIVILSASILGACGIIFLVLYLLNPFCIFGHNVEYTLDASVMKLEYETSPTCDMAGTTCYRCRYCGHMDYRHYDKLGHAEENGVCTGCGEVIDPYKALRYVVKNKGTLSDDSYMLSKEFTDNDSKSWISVDIEDEKIAFGYADDDLILVIYVSPTNSKQDIMLVYALGGQAYYSQGYIYKSVDLDNLTLYDFSSSIPSEAYSSMKELAEIMTGKALRNISRILKETDPAISMKSLGFANIE